MSAPRGTKLFVFIPVPLNDGVPFLGRILMGEHRSLGPATHYAEAMARQHGTAYMICQHRRDVQKPAVFPASNFRPQETTHSFLESAARLLEASAQSSVAARVRSVINAVPDVPISDPE